MNKLFIYYVSLVVLIFMASPAFSIQYCKDFLEPGNSGGWGTSIKTWEDELTLAVTEEVDVDIWINDMPEKIVAGGFFIIYDSTLLSIVSVDAYDTNDLPGPWSSNLTTKFADPAGPGTYLVYLGGGNAVPDTDGDIILAKVRFRAEAEGDATIEIMLIPGPDFDTFAGVSGTIYDPQITPNTITIHQIIEPCCTHISPDPEKVFSGKKLQFTANKTGTCNLPDYVWSEDCTNADIDPVTGLFTAETITIDEECSVCVIDNANPSSCTDSECDPPADCCANFTITNDIDDDGIADDEDNCPNHPNGPDLGTCIYGGNLGQTCTSNEQCGSSGFCTMDQEDNFPPGGNGTGEACECEGDFDADGDVDGTDASTFKADFGRGSYNNPCVW